MALVIQSLSNAIELSMLIGSDYYWRIVLGQVERVTVTLVAIESIFGWSVQGPVKMYSVASTSY